MFDRFTDRARKAMSMSRKQTIRLGHGSISEIHIFLGILEADGRAAQVLRQQGIEPERVGSVVDRRVTRGEATENLGQIPLTREAKRALEASMEEAALLECDHIGTEHLLLGLLRIHSRALESIFDDLRLDRERVLNDILALLDPPGKARAVLWRSGPRGMPNRILGTGTYSIADERFLSRLILEVAPGGWITLRPAGSETAFEVAIRLDPGGHSFLEIRDPEGKVLWTFPPERPGQSRQNA